jgi:protocatechuate 3,4-dioxygenase alpha subunit
MENPLLKQTPSQTVGPFFHMGLLLSSQSVLVNEQTTGQRIRILGRIFDGNGQPIPDALIEIWQADAHGFFNHPADPNFRQADPHFQGFGRSGTVNDGWFEFKTIKPGGVPGPNGQIQAPYINIRVFSRGMLIHAYTRLYFSDEITNASDPVLTSLEPERRASLIATLEDSHDLPTYRFAIHMQGERETVFFEP